MEKLTLVTLIIPVALFTYLMYTKYYKLTFWKRLNVKGPSPKLFFGNYKDNILGKIHSTELVKRYYDKYENEPVIGIYALHTPVLILRDLNLIKDVLIKDFSIFPDRGISVNDKTEPLSEHFFNLTHSMWYLFRRRLSPPFTNLKIKEMFNSMWDITIDFVSYVERESCKSDSLECSQLLAKFTTEVIGEYGFSLKMNEFHDENSEFRKISKSRLRSTYLNFIRRYLREYMPLIYKYCASFLRDDSVLNFYVNSINDIARERKVNNIEENDYVGILIAMKDDIKLHNNIKLTDSILAAHMYVFFTAGSDTTAIIISYALFEIANNPQIQEKIRQEIKNTILTNENKCTFESIKNMQYLDKVFKETLRKYPLRNIIRHSNKSYTFSGTNITIPINTHIIIPNYAIHHDSKIYPDYEVFNPDRFDANVLKNTHPMSYIPFGKGPRSCIGEKFADIISKIVIFNIIRHFQVELPQDYKPRENDPMKVLLFPKGGIHLKFKKL